MDDDPHLLISRRFPYLPVEITVRAEARRADALIDTGFTGFVVMPNGFVPPEIPPDVLMQMALADGSLVTAPAYAGAIRIGSFDPITAPIVAFGEETIVGEKVIGRFRVTLDHGERVIVES